MVHKIKDISETLFTWLAKITLDDYEYTPPNISEWNRKDWQVSKTIIFMHGMGPLWGYYITKGWSSNRMPEDVSDYLKQQFHENTKRIKRIHQFHHKIGKKFIESEINYLPFKGIVFAEKIYPHPGCRPMADIDIYTGANSAVEVTRIMSDVGFTASKTSPSGITYYPESYIEDCLTQNNNKDEFGVTLNESRFDGESLLMPFSVDVHFSMDIKKHWANFNLSDTFETALISEEKRLPENMMMVYFLLHAALHTIPHFGRWIHFHDLYLLLQQTEIDSKSINKIGRELGVSHLLLLPLVICRNQFSMQKSELEALLEKEVSWRFKRLINNVELSTYSMCNPSDSLFSMLPWMLNISAFGIALRESQQARSESTLKSNSARGKYPPFVIRILMRIKKILSSQPSVTWKLLAAHNLNPSQDWK